MNKFIINCLMRKHGSTPLRLGLVEVSHPLTKQDPCKDSPSHHKPTTFAKQVFTLIARNLDHAHDEKRPASLCLEKCARVYCYFCGLSIVWQKLYKTRDQKRINQWLMVQLISHVTWTSRDLESGHLDNSSKSHAQTRNPSTTFQGPTRKVFSGRNLIRPCVAMWLCGSVVM